MSGKEGSDPGPTGTNSEGISERSLNATVGNEMVSLVPASSAMLFFVLTHRKTTNAPKTITAPAIPIHFKEPLI